MAGEPEFWAPAGEDIFTAPPLASCDSGGRPHFKKFGRDRGVVERGNGRPARSPRLAGDSRWCSHGSRYASGMRTLHPGAAGVLARLVLP